MITVSLCFALARVLHFHGSRPQDDSPQPFQVPSAPGGHIIADRDVHRPGSFIHRTFLDSGAVALALARGVAYRDWWCLGKRRSGQGKEEACVPCATCRALPSMGTLPRLPQLQLH